MFFKRNGQTITINLAEPGMTALHKAGLAGLWMTLEALEKENGGIPALPEASGSWERNLTSISLRWDEDPNKFFNKLFEKSFKIDENGLVWFPGLGRPADNLQHAVILQEAFLGSFLQHSSTRQSDPSRKPGGVFSFDVDGSIYIFKFHRIDRYLHQNAEFQVDKTNNITGWLLPGGTVRHHGLGEKSTALEESPASYLALRFAPIGVIFVEIENNLDRVEPRHCFVIPKIDNLEAYAKLRKLFLKCGIDDLKSPGMNEAGFRVLANLEEANLIHDLENFECQVIAFGKVPWSSMQKTRVGVETVQAKSKSLLQTFRVYRSLFKPKLVKTRSKELFWNIPQMPELIAKNLKSRRQWWEGFAEVVSTTLSRQRIVNFEREGLQKMIENPKGFTEESERIFVSACQQAWHRRLGKISEKAFRDRSSFSDQANREFANICMALSQCKNSSSLRRVIINLWIQGGGPLKPLQDGWQNALTLLDNQNWRKGKDLALLAMVSYKAPVDQKGKL